MSYPEHGGLLVFVWNYLRDLCSRESRTLQDDQWKAGWSWDEQKRTSLGWVWRDLDLPGQLAKKTASGKMSFGWGHDPNSQLRHVHQTQIQLEHMCHTQVHMMCNQKKGRQALAAVENRKRKACTKGQQSLRKKRKKGLLDKWMAGNEKGNLKRASAWISNGEA